MWDALSEVLRKRADVCCASLRISQSSTKKRFDSGEWAMERMGFCCVDTVPADVPVEQLSPKLGPEGLPLARRRSPLEAMIWEVEYEKELLEHMDH